MRITYKRRSASLSPLAVRMVGIAITFFYLLVSSLIHCQHTCNCHCGFNCACTCTKTTGDDRLSPDLSGKHSCCIPLRLEEKAGPSSVCRHCHSGKSEPAPSPSGKDDCPACRYLNSALASGVPLPVTVPTTEPHVLSFTEPLAAPVFGSCIRPAARAPPAA